MKIVIVLLAGILAIGMPPGLSIAEEEHGHPTDEGHSKDNEHGDEHEGHDEDNEHGDKHEGHDENNEHGDKHEGHDEDDDGNKDHDQHEAGGVSLTAEQIKAAGIVSQVLQLQTLSAVIRAPGEIRQNAYATSKVTPRIAAQILNRHAKLGETVRQGQPLLTLSSVEMAQAQGELLVAEREWRRVQKLGRKVVSEQRYTEARVTYEQARARTRAYGLSKREIKKLLAQGTAELADGRFQLLAPQAGTVIHDAFFIGERVEPGRELFEITDESQLWVEARLTPVQAAEVVLGAQVTLVVQGQTSTGKVIQLYHALDKSTRTQGVRIAVSNPEDRLHPGLFVEARIEGKATAAALAVPSDAVLRSADGDWQVFVEHETGEFVPQEVEVLRTSAGWTVIEGLEPGTRVAIQGAFFLQSELAKSGFEIHNH